MKCIFVSRVNMQIKNQTHYNMKCNVFLAFFLPLSVGSKNLIFLLFLSFVLFSLDITCFSALHALLNRFWCIMRSYVIFYKIIKKHWITGKIKVVKKSKRHSSAIRHYSTFLFLSQNAAFPKIMISNGTRHFWRRSPTDYTLLAQYVHSPFAN